MPLLNLGMAVLHNIQKLLQKKNQTCTLQYLCCRGSDVTHGFLSWINCNDRNSLFHFTIYIFEIIVYSCYQELSFLLLILAASLDKKKKKKKI